MREALMHYVTLPALAGIEQARKGDPLEAIDRLVPWETFRADIEAVVLTPEEMRKSSAGRKSLDAIVMFRMLVLQALNNFRTSRRSIRCVIGYRSRDF